jgi:hypothetical protein
MAGIVGLPADGGYHKAAVSAASLRAAKTPSPIPNEVSSLLGFYPLVRTFPVPCLYSSSQLLNSVQERLPLNAQAFCCMSPDIIRQQQAQCIEFAKVADKEGPKPQ